MNDRQLERHVEIIASGIILSAQLEQAGGKLVSIEDDGKMLNVTIQVPKPAEHIRIDFNFGDMA